MNLSELILERKISDIKIGDNLNHNIEIIKEEEGDIPCIAGFYIRDYFFEIIVAKGIVVGIQFDFQYETRELSFLKFGDVEIVLSENTSLKNFKNFLDKVDIEFETVESKLESTKVILKKSNSSFYFDDENFKLFKLRVF
ncbi:hypothetical protein [Flavobacterium fontis]|nr:hypothetical protein [Flavobacterium fontis]